MGAAQGRGRRPRTAPTPSPAAFGGRPVSWLRFASDWRNGPLQRHPWLPWSVIFLFAVGYFIAWGYERDWNRGDKYTFNKRGLGPQPTGFMPTERQSHP